MILVAGATGQLGGFVTRRLLANGEPVRVLVREGSPWQAMQTAGAQISLGDLKNRATLDAACAGVDVVITTATREPCTRAAVAWPAGHRLGPDVGSGHV